MTNWSYSITIKGSPVKLRGVLAAGSAAEVETTLKMASLNVPWGPRVTLRVTPTIEEATE